MWSPREACPNLKKLNLNKELVAFLPALGNLKHLETLQLEAIQSQFFCFMNVPTLKHLIVDLYYPFYSSEVWESFVENHQNLEKLTLFISNLQILESAKFEISIIIENIKVLSKLKIFALDIMRVQIDDGFSRFNVRALADVKSLQVSSTFLAFCLDDYRKLSSYFPGFVLEII